MAHERARQSDELYSKLIQFSPIVGVFGHRQVGKSTYTSGVAGRYLTLDDRDTRVFARSNPRGFVQGQGKKLPVVIDECQLEPDLFPALKEHVRIHKKPGQFVLTGSVRFTSRAAIRESLAGRMTHLELYPLILSELDQRPLPDLLPRLQKLARFTPAGVADLLPNATETQRIHKGLEQYLLKGGLPGLCFVREDRLRREGLLELHRLILDRDLRLVLQTKLSIETLQRWLEAVAQLDWQPYNASEIKRQFGLAPQTQKALLYAMESIFLLRRIPLIGGRRGETLLLEDQYEERTLTVGKLSRSSQILSAFFRNARAQYQYRLGDNTRYASYRTRHGAVVPLVIQNEAGKLGVIPMEGERPTLSQTRSMDSFLRSSAEGQGIFVSDQVIAPRVQGERVLFCSAAALL